MMIRVAIPTSTPFCTERLKALPQLGQVQFRSLSEYSCTRIFGPRGAADFNQLWKAFWLSVATSGAVFR